MAPQQHDTFYQKLFCLLMALAIFTAVMACDSDTSSEPSGTLSFQAVWPASEQQAGEIHSADVEDVCTTYGIETIRAHVLGYGGFPMGTRQWPCDTPGHTGTIDLIPPGTQYQVVVEGIVSDPSDQSAQVNWRGQRDGVTIVAGQTNHCGRIEMINVEPRYTISASANTCGQLEPSGDIIVAEGAHQEFGITADAGCHIADIVVDGISIDPTDRYIFYNVTADHSIVVDFRINGVEWDYSIVSSSSGGGTISFEGIYLARQHSDRSYVFTPNSGYIIADVIVDEVSLGPMPSYAFENITQDHTIHVDFYPVRYVDGDASASGDGTSWEQAFRTIPEAIISAVAVSAGEIWVKAGRYQHSGSLQIEDPVMLYGGFAGTENQRSQRNIVDHVTTIDAGNIQHGVVITANATLDGFYIENGGASMGIVVGEGGGIYLPHNANVAPTIANCNIRMNRALDGAGIFVGENNTVSIERCVVERNEAQVGGGIYLARESQATIKDSLIAYNTAETMGGGNFNIFNAVTITNTVFLFNSAGNTGGGIMNYDFAQALVTNCTFYGNDPLNGGGAIYNQSASPTISNSIFWHELHTTGDQEIGNTTSSHPSVSYCNVRGGYQGTGNIDMDPLFVDRDYDQNLRLQFGSPCIDLGSNIAPGIPGNDADGLQRIIDGNDDGTATVDMGAYEYQPN